MTDIKGHLGRDVDYLVTGFFTPNYKWVADRLIATLDQFEIPHHIFPVTASDWHNAILLKPKVIAQAQALYPNKTIVLMDVDCTVRRPIDAFMQEFQKCDVAMAIRVKPRRAPRGRPEQDQVLVATRVTVWRPTEGASRLLAKWSELCRKDSRHEFGDEGFLTRAISQTPHLLAKTLPREYVGHEITDIGPEAVIVHQTTRQHVPRPALRRIKRAIFKKITGKSYDEWKYGQ